MVKLGLTLEQIEDVLDGKSDLKERDLAACSKLFDANDLRKETATHY